MRSGLWLYVLLVLASVMMLTLLGVTPASAADALVSGGLTERAALYGLGPNLIQNPGFEAFAGSLPAGWSGNTAWSIDPLVSRSGAASIRLTDASTSVTYYASQPVMLKKGDLQAFRLDQDPGSRTQRDQRGRPAVPRLQRRRVARARSHPRHPRNQ